MVDVKSLWPSHGGRPDGLPALKFWPGPRFVAMLCAASIAGGLLAVGDARADVEQRGALESPADLTVRNRPRPELEAIGARVGGFLVYPIFEVVEEYDDNVFSTRWNKKSDEITILKPEMRVRSDWNRHFLSGAAGGNIGLFAKNSDEDYEDYWANIGGRLDLPSDLFVSARAVYRNLHQDRSSPDGSGGVKPTEYDILNATGEIEKRFGRFNTILGVAFSMTNYDDTQTIRLGVPVLVNEDDRDRHEISGFGQVGYEFWPGYETFLRGTYNIRDYDSRMDDNGFDRDSEGYEVVGGVEVDFGGIVFGDFFAGYRSQDIDHSSLKTIKSPTFGADLIWNVTRLTTVGFEVTRGIAETTVASASGSLDTAYDLTVDHELLRNLVLSFRLNLRHREFKSLSRESDRVLVRLEAEYFMNRRLYLVAGYTYETEDSMTTARDFDRNLFRLRVGLQL